MSEEYKYKMLHALDKVFNFWYHSKKREYLLPASRPLFDSYFKQLQEDIESGKISHDEKGKEELQKHLYCFHYNVITYIKK
jgi:hypothetical protein